MRELSQIADFLRTVTKRMRFGELTRAPLRLLRFELRGDSAECEWVARSADEWDADLPEIMGAQHASSQALQDVLAVREYLFSFFPQLESAHLRVYRAAVEADELVIAGTVSRFDEIAAKIRSISMRAKLYGLNFWLEDGVLRTLLPGNSCAMNCAAATD